VTPGLWQCAGTRISEDNAEWDPVNERNWLKWPVLLLGLADSGKLTQMGPSECFSVLGAKQHPAEDDHATMVIPYFLVELAENDHAGINVQALQFLSDPKIRIDTVIPSDIRKASSPALRI